MLILPFKIGKSNFSIGISKIVEVIPIVEFMPVSESQDYICGLINYRGVICPVIDISMLIGKYKSNKFLSTRIIIIKRQETDDYFGILAEQVTETMFIEDYQLNSLSNKVSSARYIEGTILHDGNIIQMINTDIIFDDKLSQIS